MKYGVVYLSAPMNTIDEEQLFGVVAGSLRLRGFEIMNPADVKWGTTRFAHLPAEGMRVGMDRLSQSQSVFLMGDWKNARGCIAEVLMASLIGATLYELDVDALLTEGVVVVKELDIDRDNASAEVVKLLKAQELYRKPQ